MKTAEQSDLFGLTRTLVDIPSITGSEGPCADYLAGYLGEKGWEVETIPVSPGRFNIFASRGRPRIVLSTHLDTVPPFIASREDVDSIHGRGSCDAKGIAAAEIVAAEKLTAEGMKNLGLLFLVGEETISDGAQAANRVPRGCEYIINGEPTLNKLALGTKGNLRVDLRVKGRMAHSAYPHLGESAIEKLLDVLMDVRKMPLPADDVLGEGTLNIGMISGGCAANVIPGEAAAQLLFRTVPPKPGAPDFQSQVESLLKGRCDFTIVRSTPALKMEPLDGFDTDVVAFSTDLPALTAWGRPFLLGPGSVHVAHTDNEHVRKQDLLEAVEHYCRLVRLLAARLQ
ncbi:MAG: M20/M25/M40 family metallo-hydrolase [Acidobacteriota bacterium]|nr:M20/M25/M40 family metallo-hydrolase [Acidobacteriota bacterium]